MQIHEKAFSELAKLFKKFHSAVFRTHCPSCSFLRGMQKIFLAGFSFHRTTKNVTEHTSLYFIATVLFVFRLHSTRNPFYFSFSFHYSQKSCFFFFLQFCCLFLLQSAFRCNCYFLRRGFIFSYLFRFHYLFLWRFSHLYFSFIARFLLAFRFSQIAGERTSETTRGH